LTTEERIDRLTGIVETLAKTAVGHDNQIEGLTRVARIEALLQAGVKQAGQIDKLVGAIALKRRRRR